MQYHYAGYGIKGFYRVGAYAITSAMNNDIATQRLNILMFWDRHGLAAAMEHSGKSRRTLYAWKKAYQEAGLVGLSAKSKAPQQRRRRDWPKQLIQRLRELRTEFPNLGKAQRQILLKPWCAARGLACPSASTIGRLIADAPDKMRISPPALTPKGKPRRFRRQPKTYRPKDYRPERIGECVGLDAIERRMGSMKRYILTYIDEVSDYALALALPRLNSQIAKQFFERCFKLTPFNVEHIITDGGSEFKGDFDSFIQDSQIVHLWTYPKTPKMNAVCERFNRTLQEQFVDYREILLFDDLALFNERLADWLVKYNSARPHKGLGLKTPVQVIIENKPMCNLGWTHTPVR